MKGQRDLKQFVAAAKWADIFINRVNNSNGWCGRGVLNAEASQTAVAKQKLAQIKKDQLSPDYLAQMCHMPIAS